MLGFFGPRPDFILSGVNPAPTWATTSPTRAPSGRRSRARCSVCRPRPCRSPRASRAPRRDGRGRRPPRQACAREGLPPRHTHQRQPPRLPLAAIKGIRLTHLGGRATTAGWSSRATDGSHNTYSMKSIKRRRCRPRGRQRLRGGRNGYVSLTPLRFDLQQRVRRASPGRLGPQRPVRRGRLGQEQ